MRSDPPNPDDPAEQALLRSIVANLDRGFEDLVLAYQRPVFNGVLRMSGNRADAEDIAQDAFVRMYRALRKYPPDRILAMRLRGWVWTVAYNAARNHVRSRSRRPQPRPLDSAPELADSTDVAEQAMASSVTAEWEEHLRRLKPAWREAVVMRHVAGLDYREMAEATGKPEATLRSHVFRGLEALAGAVERGDQDE